MSPETSSSVEEVKPNMVWFHLFGKVQNIVSLKKQKPAYYICAKFTLEVIHYFPNFRISDS